MKFDPTFQAQAVQSLRESIAALGETEDTQLLLDMIEGETDFFEIVDRLLAERQTDLALAAGIPTAISDLQARKRRFETRAETTKTLVEQALLLAGLDGEKVQRPLGTLFFSKRAPSVVLETESDIPARFWDDGEPVLAKKRLGDELKGRAEALALIAEAGADSLDAAVAEFIEKFPQTPELEQLAERARAYLALPIPPDLAEDAPGPAKAAALEMQIARDTALAHLRQTYGQVPGAYLSEPSRNLSIRVA
jgi:hypothetical protein